MRDIAASEAAPSVTRVADAPETAFSFATKKGSSLVDKLQSNALKLFLERRKGYDLERDVPRLHRFRGARAPRQGAAQGGRPDRGQAQRALHRLEPGELYDQKKFDTPYIRDFLLDRGVLADVSETAAPGASCRPLHGPYRRGRGAFAELGVRGYVMCHMSHCYHAGACLYFTFAFMPRGQARRARGVRRRQVGDPAGVRRQRRHALAPPRGRHRARRVARAGHLGARRRDAARAVRRHRPRRQPQPREDRVTDPRRARRRLGAQRAGARGAGGRARRRLRAADDPLHAPHGLGREHLDSVEPPVVFVANHSSHMDTPAILRALPHRWRRRTAVAAAADYFYAKRRLGWTCRWCSAPCRSRATAAGSTRTHRPPDPAVRARAGAS